MNKFKRIIIAVLIVFMGLLITGCGKKEEQESSGVIDNSKYLSLSSTDVVVPLNSTGSFDISITKAVGRFDIISNDETIASVDESVLWLESFSSNVETQTVLINGNKVGTTQIMVKLYDVAPIDVDGKLEGIYTINVRVE